jgi:hypothetical protein
VTAGDDPVSGVDWPVVDGSAPDWQEVETLALADVIIAILRARRSLPAAKTAEVARERQSAVTCVRVALCPEPLPGPVPGGQARAAPPAVTVAWFRARRLGSDLTEAFKGRDVIILR